MNIKFKQNIIFLFTMMYDFVNSSIQISSACLLPNPCIFNNSICYQFKYSYRCDCGSSNCQLDSNDPCFNNPCMINSTCTKISDLSYACSILDPCADNKCQTMSTNLKETTVGVSSPSMSAFVFTGIISIIPVLLIVLVIILVTIVRIIKCWKKNLNNNQLSHHNHHHHRRNHRHHRNQQVVYTIDTNDNFSIFDYNQAMSCSVEIQKENSVFFKEDNLPSYQDALKMKSHE